jgi:hypothetical protein
MNKAELSLYEQLVKIAGQHPETSTEPVISTPAEVQETSEIAKVASVTDFSIETLLEHPDFLRGVVDSLSRRNAEREQAMQEFIFPE